MPKPGFLSNAKTASRHKQKPPTPAGAGGTDAVFGWSVAELLTDKQRKRYHYSHVDTDSQPQKAPRPKDCDFHGFSYSRLMTGTVRRTHHKSPSGTRGLAFSGLPVPPPAANSSGSAAILSNALIGIASRPNAAQKQQKIHAHALLTRAPRCCLCAELSPARGGASFAGVRDSGYPCALSRT